MKYYVEECGRGKDDSFSTIYGCADTPKDAIAKFEEIKRQVLAEDDFFLKDGYWEEHTTITTGGVQLPCLSVEDEENGMWYELYVAETEDLSKGEQK